ncbi:MAG: alpha/beta hydrolase [Solirubrobacteraceae bacterium]
MPRSPRSLTPRQRVQHQILRTLAALPPGVQVRLSGGPPVQIDGDTLAPEVQLSLAMLERRGDPPLETLAPEDARLARRQLAAVYQGEPLPVGSVDELNIGPDGALPARHYAPAEAGGPHPLLVFYHGGGFTFGDLVTHDGVCRMLCRHSGAHVLAVDYRLAPEHPFPAAVEDARAALHWAFANAAELGADPERIGVGGDSAGGNLAAVVAQLAAHDGGPAPVLQLLIYPVTDFTTRRRSRELFGEGFLLTNSEMDWFEANYFGTDPTRARDPRASPLLTDDLSGLAPALVFTAAFDPLRDEGEEYARALKRAGTPATLRRFPGFIHAFVSAAGVSRKQRDAVIEIAGATRGAFAAAPVPRTNAAQTGA